MALDVTATFVFTDLVGSTALASRVGPAAAEEIRISHFTALRGAVESFGGTEVKNLGDGLMVMFTSTRRAVSCAVAMQQAIEKHNRRADEQLSIRVGVAVGEATEEDGDYFGTPVIEAARLCAACDDDQILVTSSVLALVGRGMTHPVRDLGAIDCKGLPEPVPAAEILWEPEEIDHDATALPRRVAGVLSGAPLGFFGREAETALIGDAVKAAVADRSVRLVAIAGEPGMGKTTLASWGAREQVAAGARVAFGGCTEGLAAPFQPWIEVVRELVGAFDDDTLAAHTAAHGHTLAGWVPARIDTRGQSRSSDAASEQLMLFGAVTDVLERSAGDGAPVIVILDDLQWSDTATLQVLKHVLTHHVDAPVAVLATYRDSDLTSGVPLTGFLADMRRETSVCWIDLAGFSDTETLAFMESAAGHPLTGSGIDLAHALRRETKGNPFFTTEMLRHLVDTGAVAQEASGQVRLATGLEDVGLPTSVREVVAHRVDRLGADAAAVLNVAAVIGLRFDFDLVVALVDLDEDAVLDVLEATMAASLVTEDRERPGQFGFVHGLVREALYQELGMTRRYRLHLRIAELLEPRIATGTVSAAEIAAHLVAASRPADVDKAVRFSIEAGDASLAALAPDDAAGWYRRALDLLAGDDEADAGLRCDIQSRLGDALRKAGDPSGRELLLDAAQSADDLNLPERYVQAAVALCFEGEGYKQEDTAQLAVVRRALELVDESDIVNRVKLLSAAAIETEPAQTTERAAFATEAVELARAGGDDALLIMALVADRSANADPARFDQLLADNEWALQTARGMGDRTLHFSSCIGRIYTLALAGRSDERAEVIREARGLIGNGGTPLQRQHLRQLELTLWLYQGRIDEAEALAASGYEDASSAGIDYALTRYAAQLFIIRLLQDRLDEIVDLFSAAARDEPSNLTIGAATAYMLCHLGRYDEARSVFPFTPDALDRFPRDLAYTTGLQSLAYATSKLGEVELAERLYPDLLRHRHLFSCSFVTTTGSLEYGAALVSLATDRHDDAVEHLRRAIDANVRAGARYWEAEARIELAETLRSRNDNGDAAEVTELLATAADCARTNGFAGLTRRIDALD